MSRLTIDVPGAPLDAVWHMEVDKNGDACLRLTTAQGAIPTTSAPAIRKPVMAVTSGGTTWVNGTKGMLPVLPMVHPRLTSIIILSGDNLDCLNPCLTSLQQQQTEDAPFEVIIVSNSKLPKTLDAMRAMQWTFDCLVWHNTDRFSFAAFNNLAAKKARGEYLLFLNDDTKATPGWLRELLVPLEASPEVGITGARLLTPDEKIQHCGIAINQPGEHYCTHPFMGQVKDLPAVMHDRVTDAVTGACLCIRRSVFDELHGFDEQFEQAYFEDTDLCLRAKDAGHKTVYAHKAVVYHHGSASFAKERTTSEYFTANMVKFKKRWDTKISNNLFTFTTPMHRFRPRRMLLRDDFLNTAGGGERTVGTLARAYMGRYQTSILAQGESTVLRDRIAERLGIDLFAVDLAQAVPDEQPDVFMNCEWASDKPGIGRERNLFWVMFPHAIGKGQVAMWLNSYDTLVANSQFTQGHIRDRWGRDSIVIYPPVRLFGCDDVTRKTQSIVSIGRFFPAEHSKKQDVLVEAFLGSDLPKAGWVLHLCGSVKTENPHHMKYLDAIKQKAGDALDTSVKFHLNCTSDEIMGITREAIIFWHATGYGESDPGSYEHFGIATVEAMSAGCIPVVINLGGQPEIVKDGKTGFLWNTPAELIGRTEDIATLPDAERIALAEAAIYRAGAFSEARFVVDLEQLGI